MEFIKPNFEKSIVNISATLAEFLGCPNDKPTLPILQKELKKDYKNVVFLILDGLGINPININLSKDSILRKNIKQILTSTFPSTTTNATTSILTNKYPMEHGWFGWSLYFDELNRAVDIYLDKDSYTHENIERDYMKKCNPILPFYKKAKTDRNISVVVPDFWHHDEVNRFVLRDVDDMYSLIKQICNKNGKQFVYAYCGEPDHTMHEYGVTSRQSYEIIAKINKGLEDLSESLSDTLFVITADHGQVDIDGHIDAYKDKEFQAFLEKPLYLEPRATGICVKKGMEKEFEKFFEQKFSDDFKLFKTEEMIAENYFGGNFKSEKAKYLPQYIAVAKTNKMFQLTKDMPRFKGHHTSLMEEMEVPLILIGHKA